MKRLSMVQQLYSNTVVLSSVLQIGDSKDINARSLVLAVQRQQELFFGIETEALFPVFTKPIPRLNISVPDRVHRLNESPVLSVRSVFLMAASASSVVHIGSTSSINAETRIKHIRQLAESSSSPHFSASQPAIPTAKDE